MLALHARRSAGAIQAWAQAHGSKGLAVVLTGTDLYQDIGSDPAAQRSLHLADRLVVLQELGVTALPEALRAKAAVIYQSTEPLVAVAKTSDLLRAVMVGHLRAVKSPETLFEAAQLLASRDDIRIDHIGEALEPALGEQARTTALNCPGYHWLGALPHDQTREYIRRAHLLIMPAPWKVAPTWCWRRFAAERPCWRPGSPATSACWARITRAISRMARPRNWPR